MRWMIAMAATSAASNAPTAIRYPRSAAAEVMSTVHSPTMAARMGDHKSRSPDRLPSTSAATTISVPTPVDPNSLPQSKAPPETGGSSAISSSGLTGWEASTSSPLRQTLAVANTAANCVPKREQAVSRISPTVAPSMITSEARAASLRLANSRTLAIDHQLRRIVPPRLCLVRCPGRVLPATPIGIYTGRIETPILEVRCTQ